MGVLADKVVLVTGVARGCGPGAGGGVLGGGRQAGGLRYRRRRRATAATVQAAGGEMIFVEADVADDTAVRDLVATAVQTYGGLDCAVNNAGTEATGPIADSTDDVFDKLLAVNLKGLLSCLRHEIAAMRVRDGGSIVNMSSVTSDITAVAANGLYAATNGGVTALTKAAAIEVAKDNISVNTEHVRDRGRSGGVRRGGVRRHTIIGHCVEGQGDRGQLHRKLKGHLMPASDRRPQTGRPLLVRSRL